ncbi:MAG: hypothetical protein NXI10_12340 [bacterium]|nr:hypothetical protein [bacterium]
MKNLLLVVALCVTSMAYSQDYFFRSDAGIGGAFTTGNFKAYGISASAEPKFFFNPNISVGLRLEGDVLFGGSIQGTSGDVSVGLSSRAAYCLKGEYYLGDGNTKPFVGLSAGWYTQANIGTNVQGEGVGVSASAVRSFGLGPELGVTFGNFRISGIYNFVPGQDLVSVTTSVGGVETVEVGRSYVVIQLGFRAFGINDK